MVSPSSLLAVLESKSPCISGTKSGVQLVSLLVELQGTEQGSRSPSVHPQPHPDLLFCDKRGISHLQKVLR